MRLNELTKRVKMKRDEAQRLNLRPLQQDQRSERIEEGAAGEGIRKSREWPCDRILTNDMEREDQGRIMSPKSKRSGFKSKPLYPIRFTHAPSCCMECGSMLDSWATTLEL